MAKKSWIERNKRKEKTVAKFADLRRQLKAEKDYVGLSMLPRDASPTRVVNRCDYTGRRRGYLRRFKLSRIAFRELASAGMIPGVTKSSFCSVTLRISSIRERPLCGSRERLNALS